MTEQTKYVVEFIDTYPNVNPSFRSLTVTEGFDTLMQARMGARYLANHVSDCYDQVHIYIVKYSVVIELDIKLSQDQEGREKLIHKEERVLLERLYISRETTNILSVTLMPID